MKVTVIENNCVKDEGAPIGWYQISDSAWTNAGKPFYIPEETGEVTVSLAPVIRFNRLGKSISEKFARRYYSEIAPALHFRLPSLRDELLRQGLSPDPSVSFDRSLIVGSFVSMESLPDHPEMELKLNGETVALWNYPAMKFDINHIISRISKTNTVKMGDFLIPVICGFTPVKIGDRLDVIMGSVGNLAVKVK